MFLFNLALSNVPFKFTMADVLLQRKPSGCCSEKSVPMIMCCDNNALKIYCCYHRKTAHLSWKLYLSMASSLQKVHDDDVIDQSAEYFSLCMYLCWCSRQYSIGIQPLLGSRFGTEPVACPSCVCQLYPFENASHLLLWYACILPRSNFHSSTPHLGCVLAPLSDMYTTHTYTHTHPTNPHVHTHTTHKLPPTHTQFNHSEI